MIRNCGQKILFYLSEARYVLWWKFLSSLSHSVDIFDELIAELMLKWLERNHLILFSQFAVRFDHSTLNRARDDIEQGFIVVKIFDINKALNRTSHETLFVALNKIGFLVFFGEPCTNMDTFSPHGR